MNLTKLFEAQKLLDERIEEKHNLQGVDLLDKKILALQVELGELAQEWRGFKYWSKKQARSKNTSVSCSADDAEFYYCEQCKGEVDSDHAYNGYDGEFCSYSSVLPMKYNNPLLEEYVDCLHFILSIGNDLGFSNDRFVPKDGYCEIAKALGIQKVLIGLITLPIDLVSVSKSNKRIESIYTEMVIGFKVLGELLGFTWSQIAQAYYDKNKINHARQDNDY